jgi:hypothetical protein
MLYCKLIATFVESGSLYEVERLSPALRQRLLKREVSHALLEETKLDLANIIRCSPLLRQAIDRCI